MAQVNNVEILVDLTRSELGPSVTGIFCASAVSFRPWGWNHRCFLEEPPEENACMMRHPIFVVERLLCWSSAGLAVESPPILMERKSTK